jgi:hypothetical protein
MKLFLTFELAKIGKYFRTKRLAKVITTGLFLSVFLFVGIGIYFFFVSGFKYINVGAEEDIRLALSLFLYELFLLVLACIVVFSAMVSSLFNLFRGGNNNWLISSPSYKIFPRIVFVRSLSASTLPLLVMFLPAVLALHKVYELSVPGLFSILLSVILFVIMLNSLTIASVFGIGFIYYKISQKSKSLRFRFGGLVTLLLSVITLIVITLWKTVTNVDLISLFKSNEVSPIVSIANMASHFTSLPTHPFAMEIINWQIRQQAVAYTYFSILALMTLVSIFIMWTLSTIFYPLWQKFQEGNAQIDTEASSLTSHKVVYHFTGSKLMVLFKKEALISGRNFKGILWFSFLLLIWLMQIAANVILDHNIKQHGHDITAKIVTLQVIQYIIAIYFISSFTLRFVFPSFSIERKTSWILASAPLSFRRIFFGKYLFYTSFFVLVGILMNYINGRILGIPFTHAFYSTTLFVSVIIFIVTLGLSLGALFPSTETDDPEAVSTSMSGLIFTALALMYGALSDGILYLTLTQESIIPFVAFIILTFVAITLTLIKIPNIMKNRTL